MSSIPTKKAPRAAPKKLTTAEEAEPKLRVLRQFRMVMNAVRSHFRQVEKEAGVGGAQLWALSLIKSTPGLGVNELADGMDVHQSTASNLVRSLLQQEMITVEKADTDRRSVMLYILPKGQKVLRKAPAPFTGVLPDALGTLDTKTLLRLEKDLNKLLAALQTDEGAANTPLAEL
jgi:DNA-binding MarR family transcriptional regulator